VELILKESEFMKSIRFRLLIPVLVVMLGAAIAKSQTADAPLMRGHEFGMEGRLIGLFAKYLDLSDAQRAQMKAVMEKERPTLKPLMQQLRQAHEQLKPFEEGTYDEVKVRALAAQQNQTISELIVQETRIHNELFQLLTPDQQAKLKEFEANREMRTQQHANDAPAAPEE
jgi:protein CpxP